MGDDMYRVVVTGGAGFIGFNYVRELLAADPVAEVIVLDRLTYAGSPQSLSELASESRFRFVHGDIGDRVLVRDLLATARPTAVVHFAAESHVDRSIDGPEDFIQTNIVGTFHLLEECRRYLASHCDPGFRFLHVSTDEVFGALGPTGAFTEATPYDPRSPYSASKVGELIRAVVVGTVRDKRWEVVRVHVRRDDVVAGEARLRITLDDVCDIHRGCLQRRRGYERLYSFEAWYRKVLPTTNDHDRSPLTRNALRKSARIPRSAVRP